MDGLYGHFFMHGLIEAKEEMKQNLLTLLQPTVAFQRVKLQKRRKVHLFGGR